MERHSLLLCLVDSGLLLLPLWTGWTPSRMAALAQDTLVEGGGLPVVAVFCCVATCAIATFLLGGALGSYVAIFIAAEALLDPACLVVKLAGHHL